MYTQCTTHINTTTRSLIKEKKRKKREKMPVVRTAQKSTEKIRGTFCKGINNPVVFRQPFPLFFFFLYPPAISAKRSSLILRPQSVFHSFINIAINLRVLAPADHMTHRSGSREIANFLSRTRTSVLLIAADARNRYMPYLPSRGDTERSSDL